MNTKTSATKVQLSKAPQARKNSVFKTIFSWSLLKQTIKENLKLWIIITCLAIGFIILFSVFNYEASEQKDKLNQGLNCWWVNYNGDDTFYFRNLTFRDILNSPEYKDFDISLLLSEKGVQQLWSLVTKSATAEGSIKGVEDLKYVHIFAAIIGTNGATRWPTVNFFNTFRANEALFSSDFLQKINTYISLATEKDNAIFTNIAPVNDIVLASFNLSIQDAQVIGTFSKMMGTFLGLIYAILTANSLIASKVDRGSMAYILSTPIKRTTVTNTQILFLLSSIVATYLLTFAAQMIMFSASDLYFNFGKLLLAYIGYIIFWCMISSISFAGSCYFNLSKMSLAIGGGIPIAFYVFSTMAAISDDLEFFQYFSLNTLFDGNVILNVFNIMGKWQLKEDAWLGFYGIMLGISISFFTFGSIAFKKKDLPL